jgi:glycine cleavage system H lipoate-binding protein
VAELQPGVITMPRIQPAFAAGFELRENVRFHPGHTWALQESPTMVRVGIDDFAARLAGKVDRIMLPKRGQWIRQGQKFMAVLRDGGKAELVSPIEGEVTGVNEAVLSDPSLAGRDPYGQGWLVTVMSPDAVTSFRNLLSGTMVRQWMAEAASRLRAKAMVPATAMVGGLAQDGGVAMTDLTAHIPDKTWEELTREFFLT